jgi:hypothetical protein
MSFSDPSFLISQRPTEREREAERAYWQQRDEIARGAYRWANVCVVLTLVFVALPLGLNAWHWPVVLGASVVISVLAVVMMVKGRVSLGLISLLFAWAILPAWIVVSPSVLRGVQEQAQILIKEWKKVL